MVRIGAIINATAGNLPEARAEERLERIFRLLDAKVPEDARRVAKGAGLVASARELIDEGANVLVLGGGDGSIGTVAQLAANHNVALAILPLGTRNNFARDLHIPPNLEDWSRLLRDLPRRRVDIGSVNGNGFVNNVSIGMYPRMVEERDEWVRLGLGKRAAHWLAATLTLARFRLHRCGLETPEGRLFRLTPVLFVGNNQYQGGVLSDLKRPRLTEGVLWIAVARVKGKTGLVGLLWKTSMGKLARTENLDTMTSSELLVRFRRPCVRVAIDGETYHIETPLRFTIRPLGLEVIAP